MKTSTLSVLVAASFIPRTVGRPAQADNEDITSQIQLPSHPGSPFMPWPSDHWHPHPHHNWTKTPHLRLPSSFLTKSKPTTTPSITCEIAGDASPGAILVCANATGTKNPFTSTSGHPEFTLPKWHLAIPAATAQSQDASTDLKRDESVQDPGGPAPVVMLNAREAFIPPDPFAPFPPTKFTKPAKRSYSNPFPWPVPTDFGTTSTICSWMEGPSGGTLCWPVWSFTDNLPPTDAPTWTPSTLPTTTTPTSFAMAGTGVYYRHKARAT